MTGHAASPFAQPKAVFAVAFACVVSFMGIGLVDPILPAISHDLNATPSQVTLLFTSYLVITAVAMLVTGWVSSRIGAKKTLLAGLALIVVFAALAGASGSIGGIVGFRAGWGVGNALFIATSLAVIVASATGGFVGAIILYETALGLGIAVGPLLGGLLGDISWRGPFFGVAVLMAVAAVATLVLVEPLPTPQRRTGLLEPLKALRHRGLATLSLTALCYNWAFFTVLGYAPFPMGLDAIQLGLVFTGWGVLVAVFSVFGAPRLQARFGIARTLYLNLFLFAMVVLVIAIWTTTQPVLIGAVIVAGVFIGVNNTVTTQAVMSISPVERPVASAAYGFVRFIGGGLAPFAAGELVEATNVHVPFYVGSAALLLGIAILRTAHHELGEAERAQTGDVRSPVTVELGTALGGTGNGVIVAAAPAPLGPGLNGSTNGFEPHTFDLSAYAGKTVLLGIQYVSDGGVNEGGLLVDDITVGGTTVSDGSSLQPFDSPTEIRPVPVHNGNVRLIAYDERNQIALQVETNGRNKVRLGWLQLLGLSVFPKVVAPEVSWRPPAG